MGFRRTVMAEHLRALVVVLVIGMGYFYIARGAVSQLMPEESFKRWRNLWLVATLVLFLSHSVWLCTLMLGAILLAYRRQEAHIMGLYFVLLFVAPPAPAQIPGLGVIDYVWTVDHYRLLGVTLLLPAAISLFGRTATARVGSFSVDWMVLGYVSLMSFLAFREGNVTNGFRAVLSLWVDIFLPYYVASRSIRSEDGLKQAMSGYVIAAMILSIVAIFEMLRGWKLYTAVLGALGVNEDMFGSYLRRSGFLRPNATVGGSIVLGYVLVVALGFFLYLKEFLIKPLHRLIGIALLSAGIIACLSRGPWVGAAFLLITYVLIGPSPSKRLGSLLLGGLASYFLMSQFPSGQLLLDMLPFIGSIEQYNVEYRGDLLISALPVIERNLFFGSYDFLHTPEMYGMLQGDGIIDVVNTYVGVALYSGLIGLALFLGAFLCSLGVLWRGMRIAGQYDPKSALLGRALLATVLTIMLIIYTVSSIFAVPSSIGLCWD